MMWYSIDGDGHLHRHGTQEEAEFAAVAHMASLWSVDGAEPSLDQLAAIEWGRLRRLGRSVCVERSGEWFAELCPTCGGSGEQMAASGDHTHHCATCGESGWPPPSVRRSLGFDGLRFAVAGRPPTVEEE